MVSITTEFPGQFQKNPSITMLESNYVVFVLHIVAKYLYNGQVYPKNIVPAAPMPCCSYKEAAFSFC